jgi:hypothetical protein
MDGPKARPLGGRGNREAGVGKQVDAERDAALPRAGELGLLEAGG